MTIRIPIQDPRSVLAFAGALFGVFLLYTGWSGIRVARLATDWPTTEGKILASWVEKKGAAPTEHEGAGRRVVVEEEDGGPRPYRPHVEYEFKANGFPQSGRRISFADETYESEEEAKARIEPYTEGAPVSVYWANEDGRVLSVLDPNPGAPMKSWVFFIGGFLSVVGGLLVNVIRFVQLA